jgi:hypothetical protein
MKRLIIITLLSTLISCVDPNEKFTGYIVAKDYTPEHMSDKSSKTISYSGLIILPHTVYHKPQPRKIPEKWVFHIANKHETISKCVSEKVFNSKKCGDKITIKRY